MSEDKQLEIRKIYDPSDEEKEVIRFIYKDRYQVMKEAEERSELEEKWDDWEKQYENYRVEREDEEDWQSNHVVPITFSAVETALSEIVDQNYRPLILPRGSEDIPRAKLMSRIVDYTWDVADSDLELYNVMKDALILGTGIVQEYYWQDRRIIQRMKQGKGGKRELVEQEILDYDDVYMEAVKLQDFFIDEKARSFFGPRQARDCIRRYIMDINDFKAFFSGDIWNPLDNAKYVKPGGDTNYYEFYEPPDGIDESKNVEVLWYWAKKPKDRLVIVANDVLIKDGPNPHMHKQLPFARVVDIKRSHKFYGKGEAEILESTQDEGNVLRRMIIDRNHLDIDKMFLVSTRLSLSDEDLIARPHGMIPTDDVNASKPVEYGDIPRSVELSLKHLEDDATISTGINPRAQAMPQAGTATEAAILKESTLKRLRLKIWLMKKILLVPVTRLRVANIMQFYSQPKLEKIVGERGSTRYQNEVDRLRKQGVLHEVNGEAFAKRFKEMRTENIKITTDAKGNIVEKPQPGFSFFTLRPEHFMPVAQGGFDIRFDAGSNIQLSRPLMQTKMLELYDRIMEMALAVPNTYDPVKIADMVVETYDKDPNDLKPDQVIQSEQEQRLELLVQLAGQENKMMMQGQPVGPTEYSTPAHTRVHAKFMSSESFQNLPPGSPIVQAFTQHVVGELSAQQTRQVVQQGPGGETTPTSISQGTTNRRGGFTQPTTKTEEVLPGLKTGSNKNQV